MELTNNDYNSNGLIPIPVQHATINENSYTIFKEKQDFHYFNGGNDNLPCFSLFQAITSIKPITNINIEELYKKLTSDKDMEQKCNTIRQMEDKTEQNHFKCTFLNVTPSGTFSVRGKKNLIKHSGYLCLDFDDVPEVEKLRRKLLNDTNIDTVMLFVSPRGNGLKWIIRIPPNANTHELYFDAVKVYVKSIYDFNIDKSCREVSRACFLSFDTDTYIAYPFDLKELDETFLNKWLPKQENKNAANIELSTNEKVIQVQKFILELKKKNIDITEGAYDRWYRIGLALCELGEEGRSLYHEISILSEKYNESECDEKYTSLLDSYNGTVTLGSLFFFAKEHGIDLNFSIAEKDKNQFTTTSIPIINNYKPRTANQRLLDAKNQPEIKPLLGAIWNTGELHILFADTGSGKSVWGTQIADALSKGTNALKILPNDNKPMKVLFYDFELSDKQFERRYSDENGNRYNFAENFHIDNIDFQKLVEDNPTMPIDDLIIQKIKSDIEYLKPEVLVIDNLTFLKTETTQETGVALELVRQLNQLKKQYNLSMLVLAHTPKVRENTPLTVNELGGSKHLSNFVDSVSAIGKSAKGSEIRYIKQVKASRSCEMVFDAANVITVTLQKESDHLEFNYIDCQFESDHFRTIDEELLAQERKEKKEIVMQLHKQGFSIREIAQKTGVPKSTVERWLREAK